MKPLIVMAIILAASASEARDSKPVTCESHTAMTGTTTTECRQPGRRPTHCESYTNITGTTKTECR
jgi:hypothetical protein